MTDVTAQRIIDRFSARVRSFARSGINWGTNSYPANSHETWFAASNSGPTGSVTAYGLGNVTYSKWNPDPPNELIANTVKEHIQSIANQYSQVQRVRIIIYKTRSNYADNTSLVSSDNYGVAYLSAAFKMDTSFVAGDLVEGKSVAWTPVNDFIEQCRNRVNYLKTNTQRTLTNSVCHDSCHSNCHSNRGRR